MEVEICSLKRVTEEQSVRIACVVDDLKPLLKVELHICHSLTVMQYDRLHKVHFV